MSALEEAKAIKKWEVSQFRQQGIYGPLWPRQDIKRVQNGC